MNPPIHPDEVLEKLLESAAEQTWTSPSMSIAESTIARLRPSHMNSDYFEIFSGTPEKGGIWQATVAGLDRTRERVRELAIDRPGPYFALHCPTDTVVKFAPDHS